MDCGVEFALHQPDCLVPLFTIRWPMRRQNDIVDMNEYPPPEFQPQSVLEPVSFILVWVPGKFHNARYVNHT